MANRKLFGILGLGLAVAAGCGGDPNRLPVRAVEGKVTFEGQPLKGGLVVFHPKAGHPDPAEGKAHPTPVAQVGNDGSFTLTSYDGNDGAPEGDYVVTVEWRKTVRQGDEVKPGPNVLPSRYVDPATSPLAVKIAADTPTPLELKLTR